MPHLLLLSLLFLLPLLSPAQAPPTVSLTHAPLVLVRADTAVDVALVRHNYVGRLERVLIIPSRGNNRLYTYLNLSGQRYVRLIDDDPIATPISVLAMDLRYGHPNPTGQDDFVLLTANGQLASWRYSGLLNNAPASSIPLRNGLPCARTDRLVSGNYLYSNFSPDVAMWSNGPQPGMNYAAGFNGGIFQAQPSIPARPGEEAQQLVTANLTGRADGYEDAIVPLRNWAGGEFTVWSNVSNTFPPAWQTTAANTATYLTATGPVLAIGAGDVNGDGRPDVVTATAAGLAVHLNANGTFAAPLLPLAFAAPGTPRDVLLADLTGDGRPELLVLGASNTLSVYPNLSATGPGVFAAQATNYFTGVDPALLRVGDADGDGDLDVLIPCRGDHTISIFWNDRIRLGTVAPRAALVLSTFPNPARTTVQLRWDAATGGPTATAELHDVTGRQVGQWPAYAAGTDLPVADLPRGIYLLRVTGQRFAATHRLVLE